MAKWMRRFVKTALQKCAEKAEENAAPTREPAWIAGRIDQDFSNFRVPVCSRKCVRIVKWQPRDSPDSPMRAFLSDSSSWIEAIFSRESIEQFNQTSSADLGRPENGAFLKISPFEVVVSHVSNDLTLRIEEFTECGWEEPPVLSDLDPVNNDPGICNLMRRIYNATKDSEDENGSDMDGDDEVDSVDSNFMNTASVGPREQSRSPDRCSLGQSDSLHPASQAVVSTQLPNDQVPMQPKSAELTSNSRPGASSREHLLGYLGQKKANHGETAAHSPSHPPSQPPATSQVTEASVNTKDMPATAQGDRRNSGEQSSSQQCASPQDRRSEQLDSRPLCAGSPRENLRSCSVSRNNGTKSKDGESVVSNRTSASRDASANQATPRPKNPPSPMQQQKDASSPGKQVTEPSSNPNKRHRDNDERGQNVASNGRSDGAWKGLKRIKRRDVIIPKDQEELFDSPDCWVPPKEGKRMPQAHVPVGLLKQWNEDQAKLLSTKSALPTEEIRTNEPPPEPSSSPSSSRSEELPPEAWPPSPAASQNNGVVPADSSPAPMITRDKMRPQSRPHISEHQEEIGTPDPSAHKGGNDTSGSRAAPVAKGFARGPPTAPTAPTATQGTDDAESEMEISVPRGSGMMSSQDPYSTAGDAVPDPAIPLPSTEEIVGNHVDDHLPTDMSSRPQSSRRSEDGEVKTTAISPENGVNESTSDIQVPATYGNTDVRSPFRSSGLTQPDKSRDSAGADEDKALENQLNSELDSFSSSGQVNGQHDPFKASVNFPQNHEDSMQEAANDEVVGNALPAEKPQVAGTPPGHKRKLDDPEPTRPAKLQKVSEEPAAATRSPDTARLSTERKSLSAESRHAYFSGNVAGSGGGAIYNAFKNAYPNYDGDIRMFKRSCRNLQLLAAEGSLKRTLLWDDYVSREPTEYRDYLQECLQQNKLADSYDTYFVNNVTAARFKMRNLSAKRVAAIVDDNEIDDSEEPERQTPNSNRHSSPHLPPHQDDFTNGEEPSIEADNPPSIDHRAEYASSEHGASDKEDETNDREGPEETESMGWYECDDEMHETASIELGEPDDRPNAAVFNDDEETYSSDVDMDMEDEETIVVRDEGETVHTEDADDHGASKQSGKYKGATEIAESDTESVLYQGTTEISPKHDAKKATNASAKRKRENPSRVEKSRKRNTPLRQLEGPLYPPYKPPPSPPRENTSERKEQESSNHTPFWKDPNTPCKIFARDLTCQKNEMGRFRRRSDGDKTWPPMDERGVIIPSEMGPTRPSDSTGGRMRTMGWHA